VHEAAGGSFECVAEKHILFVSEASENKNKIFVFRGSDTKKKYHIFLI